jgi:hypothetical protein
MLNDGPSADYFDCSDSMLNDGSSADVSQNDSMLNSYHSADDFDPNESMLHNTLAEEDFNDSDVGDQVSLDFTFVKYFCSVGSMFSFSYTFSSFSLFFRFLY